MISSWAIWIKNYTNLSKTTELAVFCGWVSLLHEGTLLHEDTFVRRLFCTKGPFYTATLLHEGHFSTRGHFCTASLLHAVSFLHEAKILFLSVSWNMEHIYFFNVSFSLSGLGFDSYVHHMDNKLVILK